MNRTRIMLIDDHEVVWEADADGSGDLILAGDELIAAGGGLRCIHNSQIGSEGRDRKQGTGDCEECSTCY